MAGCSNSFKVDIAGSNPAGGTTAFEQVKACFSSWPVFVSAHVRQARAPNVRQTSRKPPQRFIAGQRKGPRPLGARPRRGPFSFPVRPLGYRFACPFATRLLAPRLPLGRSSLGYPSATPWLPLGVRLCPPARLPLAPSPRTAAPACKSPQAKGGPLPTERSAPRRSIFPYALGPLLPVLLGLLLAPRLPFCLPLCYPFACPLAWPFARPLGYPSGAWPRLPLGYPSACAFARPHGYPSPHHRGPPRPRADHPKRKADRSPRNGPPLGARYSLMR